MAIDDIEGIVGDDDRWGGKNISKFRVDAPVAAPEPGLAVLSLVGLALAARHRRRATAPTLTPDS